MSVLRLQHVAQHVLQDAAVAVVVRLTGGVDAHDSNGRSEEHTSELQSQSNLVCRLLLEKKKKNTTISLIHRIVSCYTSVPTSILLTKHALYASPTSHSSLTQPALLIYMHINTPSRARA